MRRRWGSAVRLLGLWGVVLLALLLPAVSLAQPEGVDEEKGRDLAVKAMGHYRSSEYKEALELFHEARKVYPTGQVLRMTGYTLLALEKWVEAADVLDEAIATEFKPLGENDLEDARKNLEKATSKIATVSIKSNVTGAVVRIEGGESKELPVTVRLVPGAYTFEVSADKHDPVEQSEDLQAGQSFNLTLDPTPATGDKPRPKPKPKPKPEPVEEDDSSAGGLFPYAKEIGIGAASAGLVMGIAAISAAAYSSSLRSSVQENIDAHEASFGPGCTAGSYELCYYDTQLINQEGERAASAGVLALGLGIPAIVLVGVGVTFIVLAGDSDGGGEPGKDKADDKKDKAALGCSPLLGPAAASGYQAGLGCYGSF